MVSMTFDKIAALRRTPLFRELDDTTLSLLAEHAVPRHYRKDELLFLAGDEAHGLFVIVNGSVRAFRESVDGREQVIHVERAGATVAEVPVFDDGAYPSTVAAEEDTDTLFLDKRDVRQLCLEHPEISLAAVKVLASRLRRCAELVEALSLKEVGQRVARFLVSEARRHGRTTGDGVCLTLTQTNQQIAARVGSVREVISRAFSRLQHDGLIVMDDRKLTIPDLDALSSFADQN
ncbi:MAG TPA: Crp/Fnr family transcriptional regulator [Pyrinomonadaceae bacterium]|nr:Crp/Fnr family transcriptional regulator [Pyrinomonadaceae bacterium]